MESNGLYSDLVAYSTELLCSLEADLTIGFINPSGERLLGRRAAELVGTSIFTLLHPKDADPLRRVLDQPPGKIDVRWNGEGERQIDLELLVHNHATGGWILSGRDVSAERRLEERLRRSQRLEAIGRLAGGVAHDFNNLLTAINGYSQLILLRLAPDDPHRSALTEINTAGQRAAALTRRLLTLNKPQNISPRPLDLNDAINEVERLLRRVLGEDVEVVTRLASELGPIYADPCLIEQLLLTLAINARNTMPWGGRLTVETRGAVFPAATADATFFPAAPGEGVLLTVCDSGAAREGEDSTIDTVREIVARSSGRFEQVRTGGSGNCFEIAFPGYSVPQSGGVDTKAARTSAAPLPGTVTVLVVEDDDAVRALLEHLLELQGYRVLTALSARSALTLCDRMNSPPNLLIADVVLPERNGIAMAEDLQAKYPGLKVLYISGHSDQHPGVRRLADQRAPFLAKPFSPEALADKVAEVLGAQPRASGV